MIVCTGHPGRDYEVIDIVFAVDNHSPGIFKNTDPAKAFQNVSSTLQKVASQVNADAIIYCLFEYKLSSGGGFWGNKPVIEFFAYGTAVKWKE